MDWDPAVSGGVAETGLYAVPWVPILLWLTAVGVIALAVHVVRGGTLRGPGGVRAAMRRALHWRTPLSWRGRLLILAVWWVPLVVNMFWLRNWDPLSWQEPAGPGQQVAEVLGDGYWQSDSVEHATSWSWTAGEPCLSECPGPRYVYRVKPGEPYAVVSTVRNDGPVRVTLLGRPSSGETPTDGLALLRDPSSASTEPANLMRFEPVALDVGESVTIALITTAAACADPAAEVRPQRQASLDPDFPSQGGFSYTLTAFPLVYEVLGWRREGRVWPHFSVAVAGCD